jgi:hypothetical protein
MQVREKKRRNQSKKRTKSNFSPKKVISNDGIAHRHD